MEKREDNLYNINYFENINNKEQKQKLAMKILCWKTRILHMIDQ